jgi:hypothetical protein
MVAFWYKCGLRPSFVFLENRTIGPLLIEAQSTALPVSAADRSGAPHPETICHGQDETAGGALAQGMSEGMFEGMSDWFHDHLEPGDIVVRLGAPPAGGGRGPAGDAPRTAVTTLLCDPAVRRPDIAVLATAADLIQLSVAIDAAMLTAATGARAPGLPTYPFERERYWFDDG